MVTKNAISIVVFILSLLLLTYWVVNWSLLIIIPIVLLVLSIIGIVNTEETRNKAVTVIIFTFLLTLPVAYIVANHSTIFGFDFGTTEKVQKESYDLSSNKMKGRDATLAGSPFQGGDNKTTIMVRLVNNFGTTIIVSDIKFETDMPDIDCEQSVSVLKFGNYSCNPSKSKCTWQEDETADLIGMCEGKGFEGDRVKFLSTITYYPAQVGPGFSKELKGELYQTIQ